MVGVSLSPGGTNERQKKKRSVYDGRLAYTTSHDTGLP